MIYLLVKLGPNKHMVIQILKRPLAKPATDRTSMVKDTKTFITVSLQNEIQKDEKLISENGSFRVSTTKGDQREGLMQKREMH